MSYLTGVSFVDVPDGDEALLHAALVRKDGEVAIEASPVLLEADLAESLADDLSKKTTDSDTWSRNEGASSRMTKHIHGDDHTHAHAHARTLTGTYTYKHT